MFHNMNSQCKRCIESCPIQECKFPINDFSLLFLGLKCDSLCAHTQGQNELRLQVQPLCLSCCTTQGTLAPTVMLETSLRWEKGIAITPSLSLTVELGQSKGNTHCILFRSLAVHTPTPAHYKLYLKSRLSSSVFPKDPFFVHNACIWIVSLSTGIYSTLTQTQMCSTNRAKQQYV